MSSSGYVAMTFAPITGTLAKQLNLQVIKNGKDPSGGTTGRVKPYGRLGWMGARAEYSHGEGFPLPQPLVAKGLRHVQSGNQIF
jgi:hypothetical protein